MVIISDIYLVLLKRMFNSPDLVWSQMMEPSLFQCKVSDFGISL